MTDYTNTYPDLANVEDWLNAKGYTGEAGACHAAMSLIRKQEARIAELETEVGKHVMRVFALLDLLPDATLCGELQEATARRHEMPARIAELKAALKPFADAADDLEDEHIGGNIWESPAAMDITAGDLRAARAAMEKKND
jgi:hypothetical protein